MDNMFKIPANEQIRSGNRREGNMAGIVAKI
jgi:hypothetical protein